MNINFVNENQAQSSGASVGEMLDRNIATTAGAVVLAGTGAATLAVGMVVVPEVAVIGSVTALGLAEVGRRQWRHECKTANKERLAKKRKRNAKLHKEAGVDVADA